MKTFWTWLENKQDPYFDPDHVWYMDPGMAPLRHKNPRKQDKSMYGDTEMTGSWKDDQIDIDHLLGNNDKTDVLPSRSNTNQSDVRPVQSDIQQSDIKTKLDNRLSGLEQRISHFEKRLQSLERR